MMTGLSGIISELNSTGAPLSALFLSFIVFSFIGWLYESTICALANYGHFANSGFLLGPCCPIYGVGAALEQITGARFWDYSKFPFNINGRVCLYGAALFGAGAVLICRIAEPALLNALELMPPTILAAAVFACAALLVIDTAFTLVSWRQLSQKLELLRIELADKVNESLKDASDSLLDRVPDAALDSAAEIKARSGELNSWLAEMSDGAFEAVRGKVEMPSFIAEGKQNLRLVVRHARSIAQRAEISTPEKLKTVLTRRELRFFNAFPEIKLKAYEGIIRATNLKERAHELFYRR